MRIKINEILDFWFVETPDEKKFKKDLKFDQVIKNKCGVHCGVRVFNKPKKTKRQ